MAATSEIRKRWSLAKAMSHRVESSSTMPDGDRFILVQNVGVADTEGGVSEAYRVFLVQNFFEELKARAPN